MAKKKTPKFKEGDRVTVDSDPVRGLVGEIERVLPEDRYICVFNAYGDARFWFGTHPASEITATALEPAGNEGYVV